jgi:hypothetical protein
MEYVTAGQQIPGEFYFSYRLFLPLSGALGTPQLLYCPADLDRWASTNFNRFNNWNLSYAIGVEADPFNSGSILAADRNFPSRNIPPYTPSISIGPIPSIPGAHWGSGLHGYKGNVLFADDHVEESRNAILASEETADNQLFYPDTTTNGAVASMPNVGSGGGPPTGGNTAPPGGGDLGGGPQNSPNYFPSPANNPNSGDTQPNAQSANPSMQPGNRTTYPLSHPPGLVQNSATQSPPTTPWKKPSRVQPIRLCSSAQPPTPTQPKCLPRIKKLPIICAVFLIGCFGCCCCCSRSKHADAGGGDRKKPRATGEFRARI